MTQIEVRNGLREGDHDPGPPGREQAAAPQRGQPARHRQRAGIGGLVEPLPPVEPEDAGVVPADLDRVIGGGDAAEAHQLLALAPCLFGRLALVDLGGGLVKKRIGRRGYGKRGGYRTLLATNRGDRWVFVYGFPKNERSNIAPAETEALKKLAAQLLSMSVQAISTAVRSGELLEVHGHAQDAISDS